MTGITEAPVTGEVTAGVCAKKPIEYCHLTQSLLVLESNFPYEMNSEEFGII